MQKRKITWGDIGQDAGVSKIVDLKDPLDDDKALASPMSVSTENCVNNMDVNKRNSKNSEAELFKANKKVIGLVFS